MRKSSIAPVKIGKVTFIPVSRYFSLDQSYGQDSVNQSIEDASEKYGAIFQGEADIRLNHRYRPVKTGYCNFLVPVGFVKEFNDHWDNLASQDSGRTTD